MVKVKYFIAPFIFFSLFSCNLKSKTEIYLERGLDILDNVIVLNDDSFHRFKINKIGVIRENEKNIRKLIFMIEDYEPISQNDTYKMRLIAHKEILRKHHISEIWDIEINIFEKREYQYIIHDIETEFKNRIDTVKIVLIDNNNKPISDTIKFNNLYLNND